MKKDFVRCLGVTLLVLAVSGMSVGVGMAQGNGRKAAGETEAALEMETETAPDIVEDGQSYAYVELKHAGFPLLLVTDGTYGYNGLEASFYGRVYGQDGEGNWKKMQVIAGSGTAYPIRYDKNGLYVAGGHFAAYYGVDWEKGEFVLMEYATETFDENGNVTYLYAVDGKTERSVEDNGYLVALYDRYEKGELVGFRKAE